MQGFAASWTPAGDLATVTYSDAPPDVSRTYRRDGSGATVTDAAGTTTYAYNGTLASGESIQGGLLDGLILSYPQSQGRRQSFTATLGGDTVSSMGYGYDDQGRLESVTEPGIGTGGCAAVFGYVPNSDLPYTTTSKAETTTALSPTPRGSCHSLPRAHRRIACPGAGELKCRFTRLYPHDPQSSPETCFRPRQKGSPQNDCRILATKVTRW